MEKGKNKITIFESMAIPKTLAIMAIPTVLSQVIILAYNLADTWFIGRANNEYMVGAVSLVLALYLMLVAIANLFGVGGGNLMIRLTGQGDHEEAKKVCAHSLIVGLIVSVVFSLLCLALMNPLLMLFGANENTIEYARQYMLFVVVIGGVPTVLSMMMPMLLRNVGYSKEAGLGVAIGGILNIGLDPLFMFVIMGDGYQVMGAGIATMISNVLTMIYFIIIFWKLRNKTVLTIPKKLEKLTKSSLKSFYSVGIPAAIIMILFNVLGVVLNKLTSSYSDIALAAGGIVLKVERLPQNIALGVCLGMVAPVAYNYAKKNLKRMDGFFVAALISVLSLSLIFGILFYFLAEPIIRIFIANEDVVSLGARFLKARSFSIPFMALGFLILNFTQAVNKGKISFLLSIIRHLILSIPAMLILNAIFGMEGLIWSQTVADVINGVVSITIFLLTRKRIGLQVEQKNNEQENPSVI